MAASQVWLWTEDGGARACPVADLRFDDDIASVDVARTVAEARLTVRADVPSEYSYALGVGAEPLDGGTVVRIGHSTSPFDAVLPAGSWRLRWLCGAAPGPVIEEHIELTPGEHRTVDAAVPVLQRWECRIVDLDQLPPLARFAQPRIDGIYPLGAGGTVTIFLPDAPSPDTRAVIYMHMLKLTVPARVTAVDASNHTFALQHGLGADDRVQLHSRGLGAQNRQIWLASVTEESRIPAWLGADADVLLVPGSERNGCVVERMDQFNQVTCWFSVRHGTREMRLEPQGHQATVRLERPCTRATIRVEGWPGMDPIAVGEVLEPGERRIFVADGTRAVLLDLVPKDRLRFPPEQTEMVVR
jgi:hypothetical protein